MFWFWISIKEMFNAVYRSMTHENGVDEDTLDVTGQYAYEPNQTNDSSGTEMEREDTESLTITDIIIIFSLTRFETIHDFVERQADHYLDQLYKTYIVDTGDFDALLYYKDVNHYEDVKDIMDIRKCLGIFKTNGERDYEDIITVKYAIDFLCKENFENLDQTKKIMDKREKNEKVDKKSKKFVQSDESKEIERIMKQIVQQKIDDAAENNEQVVAGKYKDCVTCCKCAQNTFHKLSLSLQGEYSWQVISFLRYMHSENNVWEYVAAFKEMQSAGNSLVFEGVIENIRKAVVLSCKDAKIRLFLIKGALNLIEIHKNQEGISKQEENPVVCYYIFEMNINASAMSASSVNEGSETNDETNPNMSEGHKPSNCGLRALTKRREVARTNGNDPGKEDDLDN